MKLLLVLFATQSLAISAVTPDKKKAKSTSYESQSAWLPAILGAGVTAFIIYYKQIAKQPENPSTVSVTTPAPIETLYQPPVLHTKQATPKKILQQNPSSPPRIPPHPDAAIVDPVKDFIARIKSCTRAFNKSDSTAVTTYQKLWNAYESNRRTLDKMTDENRAQELIKELATTFDLMTTAKKKAGYH